METASAGSASLASRETMLTEGGNAFAPVNFLALIKS
jgi:hypothetical protein